MNSCEFAASITALACTIINCCPKEDVAVLAITFSQLGGTLSTMLAVEELNNKKETPEEPIVPERNEYFYY